MRWLLILFVSLQLESSVILKPFFMKLTTSELHSVMTSGFATIAGAMFAATIEFGVCNLFMLDTNVQFVFSVFVSQLVQNHFSLL